MKAAWDHIARSVLDRHDIENLGQEELDFLISEHPYFPVLHFLKARMMLGSMDPVAEKSITKSALYFPNPHWYQHLLSGHEEFSADHEEPLAEILSTPTTLEDIDEVIHPEQHLPDAEVKQEAHEKTYDDKRVFLPLEVAGEQNLQGLHNGNETEDLLPQYGQPAPVHDMPAETVSLAPIEPKHSIIPEPDIPYVPEIPIEPLYTVDYFASQGIKLTSEEEETGELSAKLRSFTDWLKAMKKLHPEKLDRNMGQAEENTIRERAETSNAEGEINTEALAEIYLRQGLHHKAVAVYQKLSLLDPSKSAYFAAKIREIKAF